MGRQGEEETRGLGEKVFESVEESFDSAAAKYDRVERIVEGVVNRNDSAKSLWATIAGSVWQTVWAVFGFLSGMPREVWLVAAVLVGVLLLLYLYRQIALGKIREKGNFS